MTVWDYPNKVFRSRRFRGSCVSVSISSAEIRECWRTVCCLCTYELRVKRHIHTPHHNSPHTELRCAYCREKAFPPVTSTTQNSARALPLLRDKRCFNRPVTRTWDHKLSWTRIQCDERDIVSRSRRTKGIIFTFSRRTLLSKSECSSCVSAKLFLCACFAKCRWIRSKKSCYVYSVMYFPFSRKNQSRSIDRLFSSSDIRNRQNRRLWGFFADCSTFPP